jgi:pimeloyl-ACP methyl ester carboxylesterase
LKLEHCDDRRLEMIALSTVTSHDGTMIAYDVKGSGHPLILVGGALNTRGEMAPLVDVLAPQFSVYSYDRRGRGDSGDTLPYAVEREIEDLEALIEHAGGAAFLFGHSSGGCLVLQAARALGPKVAKIAVYEAPYNDDPAAQQAWGAYIRGLTEALASERRGDAVALFMEYVGTPPEQVAGMRGESFWPSLEAIAPTLAYDHTNIMGPTAAVPTELLAGIEAPTLVMCGSASFPFMCDTARTIAQAIPNAVFETLDGQAHGAQPEALAPVLIRFLGA